MQVHYTQGVHSWVEEGTVRVKCLAREHNTMSQARARSWTTRSGVEQTLCTRPSCLHDSFTRLQVHLRAWKEFRKHTLQTGVLYVWRVLRLPKRFITCSSQVERSCLRAEIACNFVCNSSAWLGCYSSMAIPKNVMGSNLESWEFCYPSIRAVFIWASKSNWFCVYYATRLV